MGIEFFSLPSFHAVSGSSSFAARDFIVSYKPKNISMNMDLALWSGEECLKEYALYLLKSQVLYQLFFENKVSKTLIQVAPALKELAILGKITSGPRKHGPPAEHEVIVVDGYATGHFLSLLMAPQGMSQTVQFGPMGEQSRSIFATLKNSEICEYHVVTLAEELPMVESYELLEKLENFLGVSPALIFNKIINTELKSQDLEEENLMRKEVISKNSFGYFFKNLLALQEQYLAEAKLKVKGDKLLFPLEGFHSDPLAFISSLSEKGFKSL